MNTTRILRFCLVVAINLGLCPVVSAQPQAASAQTQAAEPTQLSSFARDLARKDANAQGAVASGEPEVSLEVTEEGGVAAAILGFKFNRDLTSITVKASGPLEKGAEAVELVNLADLPGGVEVALTASRAWGVEKLFPARNLTDACLDINRLLARRLPRLPDEIVKILDDLSSKTPEARVSAYQEFWEAWYEYRTDNYPSDTPPPQWAAIEGRAVASLCAEWNAAHVSGLLLDEVHQTPEPGSSTPPPEPGSSPMVENPETARRSRPCNLTNLKEEREKAARAAAQAGLPNLTDIEAEARAARDKSLAIAEADLEAAKREAEELKSRGVSNDSIESILAAARLAHDRAQRDAQRTYEEKLAAAEKQQSSAVAQAVAQDKKAMYEALVKSIAKEINTLTGLDAPFIRKPPETTGLFQCTDVEAEKLLATLKSSERNEVFRHLRAAAPSQFFLTGQYKTSSQDFKYIADPLSLSPTSQLVATKTENEYNHAGRLGASLFWRGSVWSLGWTRKNVWKSQPSAQFCFPRGEDGGLVCTTTAAASPKKQGERVFDLQWKRLFTPTFALHAQVFYADDTDTLNPHLIAYFLPQKEKLRGGLDFSYLDGDPDGDDGVKLRLFIGVPFSLTN